MYYLIYLSSTKVLLTEEQLADILTKSRTRNQSAGITGLLMYNDGNIIQVLEGEHKAVTNIYETICKDTRHSGVYIMIEGESEQRNFPDWSMGFKNVSKEDWTPFAGYFKLQQKDLKSKLNTENVPILTVINSYMRVNVRS